MTCSGHEFAGKVAPGRLGINRQEYTSSGENPCSSDCVLSLSSGTWRAIAKLVEILRPLGAVDTVPIIIGG